MIAPDPAPGRASSPARFNPFPGLRPFEPEEDHIYFGREHQVDELLRRLRTNRWLAILGTSGCGKSSLVRAGLIPSLHGGAMMRAGASWRVAILRPGESPIENLAAALDAPEALGRPGTGDDRAGDGLARAFFETTLRASNQGLIECVRQRRLPARDNVLVLVDQLEELFRFKQGRLAAGRDEAAAFVKLLLAAAEDRQVPIYVALTMRSDFIGNCMEFAGLPEAINEGLYLVPRLSREELQSAITGPVAVGGATIARRLVARLLNDVGDDPDQLPILQHALMRTWDRWEEDHVPGEPLDLRHYEAVGTLAEALSRHAEEAFAELDPRGQEIAEVLFKALTDKGTDGRGVRRPVPAREAAELAGASVAEVAVVAERFRRPGRSFLMPPGETPIDDESTLDISHESLMRNWTRLRDWVDEEARSARLYLGAARAAERHETGVGALWRDPELQLALSWRNQAHPTEAWARRYAPSFARAMRFLDTSARERDRGIAAREARRRRELRRAWMLALILGAAALGTLALGVFAFLQKSQAQSAALESQAEKREAQRQRVVAERQKLLAERERANAQKQSQEALRQKSLAETERGNAELERGRAEEQRRIAESERRRAEAEEQAAEESAAAATSARHEAERRKTEAEREKQRADDLRASSEQSEQEAQGLRRLAIARALALQLLGPQPEGRRETAALLALQAHRLHQDNGGLPENPDLFNALQKTLSRLRPDPVWQGHEDAVRQVALGASGALFSASEDGRLRRFDLGHPGAPAAVLGSFGAGVRSVAAAGRFLAAGFADGALRLWDVGAAGAAGPPARELASQGPIVGAVALQPAGRWLAAGSHDGTVRLWDLAKPQASPQTPDFRLDAGGRRVTSLAFSPDGKALAAGLAQGGALLWETEQPPAGAAAPAAVAAAAASACAGKDVRAVAFSPDGRTLACGTGKGEILLWSLAKGAAPAILLGHASSVNSLSFAPAGDVLASAGSDSTVRLWSPGRPDATPVVLDGHDSWVWTVAFTPDGDRLVSAGNDRTVRAWPGRTSTLVREICRLVRRSLSREEWRASLLSELPYEERRGCPGDDRRGER